MPPAIAAAADPSDPLREPITERVWLEPIPDALIDERQTYNPEARYEARETTTLAFLAALQTLSGRQRAVLILRDALAWRAAEVAQLLDTTVEAVNSALQRARATMKREWEGRSPASVIATSDAELATLLEKYVAAWETADLRALTALLKEDATLTMPPMSAWYRGREAIGKFIGGVLFGEGAGRFRLVATRANGSPAFVVYERADAGRYRAAAVQVLAVVRGEVAQVDDFLGVDERVISRFGLPLVI
jgi:RNA polymerase sigma-70 factor (ECF subfamily)